MQDKLRQVATRMLTDSEFLELPLLPTLQKYKFDSPVVEPLGTEMQYFTDSLALKYIVNQREFVRACDYGTVIKIDTTTDPQKYIVVVDHGDDYLSIYEGLDLLSEDVEENVYLERHQTIGWVEKEFLFYLLHGNTYIVPDAYLKGNRLAEDDEFSKVALPEAKKVYVTEEILFIRDSPSSDADQKGFVRKGDTLDVLGFVIDGHNLWIRIGYRQYICVLSHKIQYVEWVEV